MWDNWIASQSAHVTDTPRDLSHCDLSLKETSCIQGNSRPNVKTSVRACVCVHNLSTLFWNKNVSLERYYFKKKNKACPTIGCVRSIFPAAHYGGVTSCVWRKTAADVNNASAQNGLIINCFASTRLEATTCWCKRWSTTYKINKVKEGKKMYLPINNTTALVTRILTGIMWQNCFYLDKQANARHSLDLFDCFVSVFFVYGNHSKPWH